MIVYPPNNHVTDSKSIFFIGSASDYCLINTKPVDLVYAGNFSPVFDLKLGENIFDIEIDGENFKYLITRSDLEKPVSEDKWLEMAGSKKPDPLGPFTKVCIDPGHGGLQRGTCSPKGILEKDLNLELALKIYKKIQDENITAVLTRDTDIDLSLQERVNISCENNCDLFISIHHNAIADFKNPLEHKGISVHYYYDHSVDLAKIFLEKLCHATGLNSAGLIRQNLHVLRENPKTVSLLIEFGYLIHPIESEIIIKGEFQSKVVSSLCSVIASRT